MTELLLRHLAVLGIAWLVALALRKHSAALRHALWTSALAACVALPALQLLPLPLPVGLASPELVASPSLLVDSAPKPQTLAASATGARVPWSLLALCVYLLVALMLILRWFIGFRRAVVLVRSGRFVRKVASVPVVAVEGLGPLTFGWPRAVIIVPHARLALDAAVLRHELAHVRRGDFLWQAIGTLACALWWFSPAVWFACRSQRREAEYACDDQALNSGAVAADYAQVLLEVATMKSRPSTDSLTSVPLIRDNDLGRRIAAVLAPDRDRRSVRARSIVAIALLLLPAAVFVTRPDVAVGAGVGAELTGKRIVLDPGHGGKDPGAQIDGIREADVTLAVALRARRLLEQAGATVALTREHDVFLSLQERAATTAGQDLFLSVHLEATPGTPARVYYFDDNDPSTVTRASRLALAVAQHDGAQGNPPPEGGSTRKASFTVLRHTNSPAFLVNIGSLGNPEDRDRLREPEVLDALAMDLAAGAAAALGASDVWLGQ